MPTARHKQISLLDTKYYHCISRCVRRSFLCGKDSYTGKSFEHRRQWVENRLLHLVKFFCIDICAYAVMSNHLHIVLHVDDNKTKTLSDKEVLTRWHQLFQGTAETKKYLAGERLNSTEQTLFDKTLREYKKRLHSISWFMRALNEHIARKANAEDECTGRFWEGRFKSQALLDEAALAACMAYVDLNPIRAHMASSLASSNHTSIQKRVKSIKQHPDKQPTFLMPFADSAKKTIKKHIPFDFKYYLQLVDLTGQCMQGAQKKSIKKTETLLKKIHISPANWLTLTATFTQVFQGPVGKEQAIEAFCSRLSLKRRATISNCKRLLK